MTSDGQLSRSVDMLIDRDILMQEARDYCQRAGIALPTLAVRALDNRHFFDRLERRMEQEASMAERLRAYMEEHPPQEAEGGEGDWTIDHAPPDGDAPALRKGRAA